MKTILFSIVALILNVLLPILLMGQNTSASLPGSIALVFKNQLDVDYSISYSNGMKIMWHGPEIEVYETNAIERISLEKKGIPKIEVIPVQAEYVTLKHAINAQENNHYLLRKNDSIAFEYRNGTPFASVSNRETLPFDLNFEQYVRQQILKAQFSPLGEYFRGNDKKQLAAAKSFLQKERAILDSLKNEDAISAAAYQFYKSKVQQLSHILDLEAGKLTEAQVQQLLAAHSANQSDNSEIFHQQFVRAVSDYFIAPKAKALDLKDGTNRDYRQVYSLIESSTIFPEKDKNYLLTRELGRIANTFSDKDFLSFFSKYEKSVADTALVNSIRTNYSLKFNDKVGASASLNLVTLDNKPLTFDELIKRHAGKVIYVDFWASWCAPCRLALPHSTKLREELKKDVVFIYLSIDQTVKPWQTASSKEKLDTYKENYLIVNYKTSDFVQKQQVHEIPRYMIFDKQGKLAYARAPLVESTDLKPLLLELSKK